MTLINPFVPFMVDQSTDNSLGRSAYYDASGHIAGHIQHIGNSTLISDELGRHIQTLQHLSNGTTLIQDAMGHSEGQLHHGFNHLTTLSDSLGHTRMSIHDSINGHAQITDPQGHFVASVNDLGHELQVADGMSQPLGSFGS